MSRIGSIRAGRTAGLLVLLLPIVFTAQVTLQQGAGVHGIVTDLLSGQPLQDARIALVGNSVTVQGLTDGSGQFRFDGLLPGEYRLNVSRDGYLWSERDSGPSVVSLSAAQVIPSLSLRLFKASALNGRVLDENGDAVRTGVIAMQREYRNGRRGLFPVPSKNSSRPSASTDAMGAYRIYGLEPGEYYLRVLTQTPTYYPGTVYPHLALPVLVEPGRDISALDFKLTRIPLYPVRLTVVTPGNEPLGRADWFITTRDPGALVDFVLPAEFVTVGGNRYESPRLPPGAYEVRLVRRSSWLFGHLVFDVKDQENDVGTINLTSGVTVAGSVRISPGSQALKQVNLVSANGLPLVRNGRIASDGTFVITNVPEGKFWVTIDGLPRDAYIQQLRHDGRTTENSDITVGNVAGGPLEIVVATTGGALTGTILSSLGEAAPKSHIVIFPSSDRNLSPSVIKTTQADERGVFSIRGLSPGEYKLLAWNDLPRLHADPEFLHSVERPTSAKVTENSTTAISIRVIAQSK